MTPVEPVDLDEVLARFQPSQPGEVHDPDKVEAIRARIQYAALPFWRRWFTRPPAGWAPDVRGPVFR